MLYIDSFFDCFNVRDMQEGKKTRKPERDPYWMATDWRFEVRYYVLQCQDVLFHCTCIMQTLCIHACAWAGLPVGAPYKLSSFADCIVCPTKWPSSLSVGVVAPRVF